MLSNVKLHCVINWHLRDNLNLKLGILSSQLSKNHMLNISSKRK